MNIPFGSLDMLAYLAWLNKRLTKVVFVFAILTWGRLSARPAAVGRRRSLTSSLSSGSHSFSRNCHRVPRASVSCFCSSTDWFSVSTSVSFVRQSSIWALSKPPLCKYLMMKCSYHFKHLYAVHYLCTYILPIS